MPLGSERDLIPVLDRLARQSQSVDEAIELFQAVLASEVGGATLITDSSEEGISPQVARFIAKFMDSREFPFRGLYFAPLLVGNRRVGRLIACFGSFGAPGKALPQLTAHIAQQLSEILGRTSRRLNEHPEAA
jgi:hypothetical protein